MVVLYCEFKGLKAQSQFIIRKNTIEYTLEKMGLSNWVYLLTLNSGLKGRERFMKPNQFNKKLRVLVLASVMATSIVAQAQTSNNGHWNVTSSQKASAAVAAKNGIHVSELRPDAPTSYTVKQGDTLWAISGYYLKDSWQWPALWGMNQSEIRNPHRIYPGQVLYLIRNGDRAILQVAKPVGGKGGGSTQKVKLSPSVRSISLEDAGVPVLPPEAIIPFLESGTIVPRSEFENSPRVVALPERKVVTSTGDKIYVRGGHIDPSEQTVYLVYTTPKMVRDPITNDVLGFEANFLGRVEFIREGSPADPSDPNSIEVPATFKVLDFKREISVGDHLTPASKKQEMLSDYVPSTPPADMEGYVASIYGDSAYRHASLYQIVLLNKGHLDGLERGNVVALWRTGVELQDKTIIEKIEHKRGWDQRSYKQASTIKTPDERYGLAMVFKTFDHLSYAIVMQVSDSVEPGDKFTAP